MTGVWGGHTKAMTKLTSEKTQEGPPELGFKFGAGQRGLSPGARGD